MNSKERITAAINHRRTDRIPRGEFWLEKELIKKILNKENVTFDDEIQAYNMLNIDLRVIMFDYKVEIVDEDLNNVYFSCFSSLNFDTLGMWKQKSDLFLMAGINGPFETLCAKTGFSKLMFMIRKMPERIIKIADKWADFICQNIMHVIDSGADGILIADDIAHNHSTYISYRDMQHLLFPFYKKVVLFLREKNVPVFFHSDGNINSIIPDIISIGFSGIHSLEKEADMDMVKIKNQTGGNICLMGNLSMPLLVGGNTKEIEKEVDSLIKQMGTGGGFILASSSGILVNEIPLRNLYAVRNEINSFYK